MFASWYEATSKDEIYSKYKNCLDDGHAWQKEATSHKATFDEGAASNIEAASQEEVAPQNKAVFPVLHNIRNTIAHSKQYLASLVLLIETYDGFRTRTIEEP